MSPDKSRDMSYEEMVTVGISPHEGEERKERERKNG